MGKATVTNTNIFSMTHNRGSFTDWIRRTQRLFMHNEYLMECYYPNAIHKQLKRGMHPSCHRAASFMWYHKCKTVEHNKMVNSS